MAGAGGQKEKNRTRLIAHLIAVEPKKKDRKSNIIRKLRKNRKVNKVKKRKGAG